MAISQSEPRIFISAVLRHLVAAMSGVISLAISIWQYATNHNVTASTFLIIGILVLFWTFYVVWREDYRKSISKTDLTFQLDANQSKLRLTYKPMPLAQYVLRASLAVRFANNNSQHPINMWGMGASIICKTRQKEKPIPLVSSNLTEVLEGEGKVYFSNGQTILAGRRTTVCQSFEFEIYIAPERVDALKKKCFLRLTMEAAGQPPYSADIYVDWKELQKNVALSLTPETKVQYQVHT